MAKDGRTYSEKLRDPRWQRKRLEVLQRDDFTCQECSSTTKTLHIHHLDYEKGFEPWDYPLDYLVTLCEDCHLAVEQYKKNNEAEMLAAIRLLMKDSFISCCLFELLRDRENFPKLVLLLWKSDREQLIDFIQSNIKSLEHTALWGVFDSQNSQCGACGSRVALFEKYGYSKCSVCGWINPLKESSQNG